MERNEREELVRNFPSEGFFPENGVSGKLRRFMDILWGFVMNLYKRTGCDVRGGSLPYCALLPLIRPGIDREKYLLYF